MKKISAVILSVILGLSITTTAFAASGTWMYNEYGWWYQNEDGTYPVGTWQYIDNNWYYFNDYGYMQTGWFFDGGSWYFFETSGKMATGWQIISGYWYYFNESGAMMTGWQIVGDNWYYFLGSGVMVTGVQTIDGETHCFSASGEWLGTEEELQNYGFRRLYWGASPQDVMNQEGLPNYQSITGNSGNYGMVYYNVTDAAIGVKNAKMVFLFTEELTLVGAGYNIEYKSLTETTNDFLAIYNQMVWQYGNPISYEKNFRDSQGNFCYYDVIFNHNYRTKVGVKFSTDGIMVYYLLNQ